MSDLEYEMTFLKKHGLLPEQAIDRIAELEADIQIWNRDNINRSTRIAELEGLIADLECNGVFCGLDNQLCDNCRIRFKALGEAK